MPRRRKPANSRFRDYVMQAEIKPEVRLVSESPVRAMYKRLAAEYEAMHEHGLPDCRGSGVKGDLSDF